MVEEEWWRASRFALVPYSALRCDVNTTFLHTDVRRPSSLAMHAPTDALRRNSPSMLHEPSAAGCMSPGAQLRLTPPHSAALRTRSPHKRRNSELQPVQLSVVSFVHTCQHVYRLQPFGLRCADW